MKKIIATTNAPAALGPYSQAVLAGNTLYCSGQLGLIPETGEFAGETAAEQAVQAFKNIEAVLKEAGTGFANIVKTTCFLDKIEDFNAVNEVYKQFLGEDNFPARSALEIGTLPKNAKVEIEVIAIVD